MDPRVEKLAKLLVQYSVELKKGQTVLIAGQVCAEPLLREIYRQALRVGAYPMMNVSIDGIEEMFFREANDDQLTYVSPYRRFQVERIDAQIGIWAETNTRHLTAVDPARMAKSAAARKELNKLFLERAARKELRWSGTLWPTNAHAQDAEMSFADFEEFVFAAGHLNDDDPIKTWRAISRRQQALTDAMNKAKEIRIVAKDTDITLSVRGRRWINCDGHENFPDGEVFTGPVEKDVNGHIRFSFPAVHGGHEVEGVFLEFKNGKVVQAKADKGENFLRAMIAMDAGSCYLGELAFGVNYNINRYMRNTLFDEKIGGTVHLALGSGYPETGNANESGLHWDIVCDVRNGGKVYADGQLIQENGVFKDKRFPQPAAAKRKTR